LDIQVSGNQENAFPHAQQPEASPPTIVLIHIKSHSIIADHELETVSQSPKLNPHILCLGMAGNVC
jgi:hypothetical protein